MKIVFLAPFGIRPKGTVIARMVPLAVELQKMGHVVVIVAPPYTNPEDSGSVEVIQGVMLRNIRLGSRNRIMATPPLAWRMFRAAAREHADVVHLFKPKGYGGVAAMLHLMLQRLGVRLPPLILDTDDWEGTGGMNELHDYSSLEKRFYRYQEQWLCRYAAGVTVASRALQELVRDMGIPAKRILYLPNCVRETERRDGRAVRQRLGIGESAPVVLLYTRFFEFSQQRLYRVFAEIYRRVAGVRFLIVGRGQRGEEQRLREAAGNGGFDDAVVLAGWIEPAELPEYLAAGDVAIYPLDDTMINRCKCPAKLTELLANGIAVVAEPIGQAREYIPPDHPGTLCRAGDGTEMAAVAADLLADPASRRALGETSRDYLLKNFNWHAYAVKLHNFYEEHTCR